MEAAAAVARQQYAMAGEMFQGPAAQQWRFMDGRWQPAAPQFNAQEAPQQMKFHGGACCCWDWLGLFFSFFNLSRLVLRSPRLALRRRSTPKRPLNK